MKCILRFTVYIMICCTDDEKISRASFFMSALCSSLFVFVIGLGLAKAEICATTTLFVGGEAVSSMKQQTDSQTHRTSAVSSESFRYKTV